MHGFRQILSVLGTCACVSAGAGSLGVAPLKVTLSATAPIGSVTVENSGSADILVQTEIFSWSQSDGIQNLAATDDVVAVPPVFKLAPGAQQLVRVGLTRAFVESYEKTFRLMVTEVPTATSTQSVAVSIRHSLPVFVLPEKASAGTLGVRADSVGLQIANEGNQHVNIRRWRVRDASGAVVVDANGPGYILRGERRSIAIAKAIVGPLVFEADTASGTLKIPVGP